MNNDIVSCITPAMNNYIVSCMTTDFTNDIYEQAAPVGFDTLEEAIQYAKDELAALKEDYSDHLVDAEDNVAGVLFYKAYNHEMCVEYRIDKLL